MAARRRVESREYEMAVEKYKKVTQKKTLNLPLLMTDSYPKSTLVAEKSTTDAIIDYLKRIEIKFNHVEQRLNWIKVAEPPLFYKHFGCKSDYSVKNLYRQKAKQFDEECLVAQNKYMKSVDIYNCYKSRNV